MKKRLFIAIHYMEIGGAEISLMGLLHSLDYSRFDVDLFVYRHAGELMEYIPQEVNLLPQDGAYAHLECPISQALKDGYFRLALARLKAKPVCLGVCFSPCFGQPLKNAPSRGAFFGRSRSNPTGKARKKSANDCGLSNGCGGRI